MTLLLAIDPGPTDTAWCLVNTADLRPIMFDKVPNDVVRDTLPVLGYDRAVIEMVASYGMAVGAEVFETCVAIGRYQQIITARLTPVDLMYRQAVKMHLCRSAAAKDANIVQALVDRFAVGQRNRGKGTKAEPGWFHGFRADVWQAYALAVTYAETSAPLDRKAGQWADSPAR